MKYHLLSDENESFKTKIIAGGERGQLVEQSFKAGEKGGGLLARQSPCGGLGLAPNFMVHQ